MTDIAIQKQVDAIKEATKKANQSKETAINFLVNARIMSRPSLKVTYAHKQSKEDRNN